MTELCCVRLEREIWKQNVPQGILRCWTIGDDLAVRQPLNNETENELWQVRCNTAGPAVPGTSLPIGMPRSFSCKGVCRENSFHCRMEAMASFWTGTAWEAKSGRACSHEQGLAVCTSTEPDPVNGHRAAQECAGALGFHCKLEICLIWEMPFSSWTLLNGLLFSVQDFWS